ncbi:MAG: hypothetical protein QOI15_701 [Pseudonocardiales bacterium]|jgi:hypothetical protein|nr:hypothetical protein [Pseudonocardiales bacterium]MDT4940929.1 hypothetical protein [Pseudonocardiales bacterium]
MTEALYSKYRAIVVDNVDPEQHGRLKVRVPDVGSDFESWAVPSWPAGSTPDQHHLPDVGADIWVEFEHGDANYPIWSGVQ